MDLLTRADLNELLKHPDQRCVSIYMPTNRGGSEQDPIQYRVHLAEAEVGLAAAGMAATDARALLKPAHRLQNDLDYWKHQGEGLAMFLAPNFMRFYRLPVTFHNHTIVGRRFFIKPLIPFLCGDGRFFVLAISQNDVRLLEGTRQAVREIDLKGLPKDLTDALGEYDTGEPVTYHPHSGGRPGSGMTPFHGHGVGIDDKKEELLRYVQTINQGMHALLREERSPFILAAVEYVQSIYRQANTYPHLLDGGIDGSPDRTSNHELHDKAWKMVQPTFEEARERAIAIYQQLAGTGRTGCDLKAVVGAAQCGEVQTLFVACGADVWGRLDETDGHVEVHDRPAPGDEDLIDLAAAQTLRHGHDVFAVDAGSVPGGGVMAAIFHLPMAKRGSRRMAATTHHD